MDFIELLQARSQEKKPLLQVILGPRQVGKTTAAEKLFNEWHGSKLMISADSPSSKGREFIEANWLHARTLLEPCLFIIDEVQKIGDWSEKVKELFDQDRGKRDLRIFLLGSASLSVQSGLNESLAGRFEVIRASHWQYSQMKSVFGWDLETYLKFGGYPGAARFIDEERRWRSYLMDSIIEPVLSRDLGLLVEISKPALFRQLFALSMEYPAQEVSYQKLAGQLQERGVPQTIKNYLQILEGGFLIKQVYQYSTRPLTTRTSSPKIIPMAPALINGFTEPMKIDIDPEWRGRVFEACVGARLASMNLEINFWREKDREVDYVIKCDGRLFAIEVKSSRVRKVSGLSAFLTRFPKAKPVVVTPENFVDFENLLT